MVKLPLLLLEILRLDFMQGFWAVCFVFGGWCLAIKLLRGDR